MAFCHSLPSLSTIALGVFSFPLLGWLKKQRREDHQAQEVEVSVLDGGEQDKYGEVGGETVTIRSRLLGRMFTFPAVYQSLGERHAFGSWKESQAAIVMTK